MNYTKVDDRNFSIAWQEPDKTREPIGHIFLPGNFTELKQWAREDHGPIAKHEDQE